MPKKVLSILAFQDYIKKRNRPMKNQILDFIFSLETAAVME